MNLLAHSYPLYQYYFLYWLVGIASAYLICPAGAEGKKGFAGLMLAIIATAIPFFGPVVSVVYAFVLRGIQHRAMEPDLENITVPEHARDSRLVQSSATAGSATARLKGSRDPRRRMEVLTHISDSRLAAQHQILRSALSDSAEEVRLLAYAALDRREEENAGLVMKLEQQMQTAESPEMLGRLRQYRRWLDWNIAHAVSRDTAEPETGRPAAEIHPAASPGKEVPQTAAGQEIPSMSLLQGLESLEKGEAQAAIMHLERAMEAGVAAPIIAPPLAAAYFLVRRYDKIMDVYQHVPELALSPRYAASAGLWTGIRK